MTVWPILTYAGIMCRAAVLGGHMLLAATLGVGLIAAAEAPSGDGRAAKELHASTDCDETGARSPTARLAWEAAAQEGEERVEVTTARDGFETGRMESSDLLPAGTTALLWTAIHGRSSHYWRVLTRHGGEWVASESARFTPPQCGGRLTLPPILPPTGGARNGTESPVPPARPW